MTSAIGELTVVAQNVTLISGDIACQSAINRDAKSHKAEQNVRAANGTGKSNCRYNKSDNKRMTAVLAFEEDAVTKPNEPGSSNADDEAP